MSLKRKIYGLPVLSRYRAFRTSQLSRRFAATAYGFDFAGSPAFLEPSWEPHERRLIGDHLPLVDVFVDVGANQGFYSCLAARARKHVVAIEPEPGNLRFLRANADANGFAIEVYPVALGNKPGAADLYGDGNTASLKEGWLGVSSYFRQTVPVETLDNLIADRFASKRLLIKIDVEGGENPVLRGARSLIERKPTAFWLIETFPTGDGQAFTDVFRLMWAAGYIAQMADVHLTEVSPDMVQRWVDGADFTVSNFFFTHRDWRG